MKKYVTKENRLTFGGKNISMFLLIFVFILFSSETFTQNLINGKVTSNEGEILCGVNVVEKGTTNGTITDLNGEYSLTVSDENSIKPSSSNKNISPSKF